MYSSLPHVLILFITYGAIYLNADCIPYSEECNEDCDCCGWADDESIRCELRSSFKGTRCHISRNIGEHCDSDRHCKSQYCVDGQCTHVERHVVPPQLCNLTISDADPIKGNVMRAEDGVCPCPDPNEATKEDTLKATDGDLSTVYVNNYALNSGLQFHASSDAPLYKMTICSASDCTECDPTCYKLEGFCPEKGFTSDIQEGSISFNGRNECIVIPITSRAFFSQYLLTFPCQRGGFKQCLTSTKTCQCSNGIVPFEPPVATKQSCNGVTPVSTNSRLRRRLSQNIVHVPHVIHLLDSHAHPKASPQNMRNVEHNTRSIAVEHNTKIDPNPNTKIDPNRNTKIDFNPYTKSTAAPTHVEHPTLTYKGATKVGDITEIVYMVKNVHGFEGFSYAIIQWSGSCCFDCYDAFMDYPTNGVLDETDEKCNAQCKGSSDLDNLLIREDDPLLCMRGIKLYNDAIFGEKNYFFKVKVHGDITMEMKPYGMTRRSPNNSIIYGDIESPVCASCKSDGAQQCQNYPLQVAEVSLSSKCKDIP